MTALAADCMQGLSLDYHTNVPTVTSSSGTPDIAKTGLNRPV